MSKSNAHLAALLGEEQEDFAYSAGERHPTLYWRSGNVQAADLAAGTPHHTGLFFIAEDAVPANEDGSMVEMTGFEKFSYTNAKNEKVHGYGATRLTFQIAAQRRCHMDSKTGARLPWKEGWAKKAYKNGYDKRTVQVMVNIQGIDAATPFIISLSNKRQMAFSGGKDVEGVIPEFQRVGAAIVAEEEKLPEGSLLPLRGYWITVDVKRNEAGEPEFTTSKYKDEAGNEQDSPAKTIFCVDASVAKAVSAEDVAKAAAQRVEYEEWRNGWEEAHEVSVEVIATTENVAPEQPSNSFGM